MTARVALALALATSLLVAGYALAEGPAPAPSMWKNLQVLPKTIAKDQIKAMMKAQSRALGVECDHCHEAPNMDVDTKNKKIAREMMRMTSEINQKFLKGMDDKVTCATCHRGKEKPEITAEK
jgi:hypothetical protein